MCPLYQTSAANWTNFSLSSTPLYAAVIHHCCIPGDIPHIIIIIIIIIIVVITLQHSNGKTSQLLQDTGPHSPTFLYALCSKTVSLFFITRYISA
jgi:hypothetical protein